MDIRINKWLSQAGYCSRRAADELISLGRVTVDGRIVSAGDRIDENATVFVDGKQVVKEEDEVLIAFYKPRGIVSTTTDKQGKNNVIDFLNYKKRIYPIGRLDKDSEGLLFLTNNGEVMNRMIKADLHHEKEYIVGINKPVTEEFLETMRNGIFLKELNKTTAKCKVEKLSDKTFKIVLIQGMNRQIRRMCEFCGCKVTKLKRVRIMNVLLGNLLPGQYRNLTRAEYDELMKELGLK